MKIADSRNPKLIIKTLTDLFGKAHMLFLSPVVWVAVFTVVGGLLRRYHLAAKSLWLDEAMLYHISRGSFLEILFKNAKMSSAPPLYPVLLRITQVFGDSELVLRGFSMVLGILSIPLAYFVFRKFISTWAALGTTLLVAIAPSQIMYSQQVREYSLTFVLALGMILTTWNFFHSPRWRNLIVLAAVWLLGVWVQYGLAVLAISLNLTILCFAILKRNTGLFFRWVLGQTPILLSIVLIYVVALSYQFVPDGSGIQYLGAGYWDSSKLGLVSFILKQTMDLFKFTYPGTTIFSAITIIGIISAFFYSHQRIHLLWIFIPLGFAILLGLLRLYPYLGTRHNLYLTPVLFLACGFGFEYLLKTDVQKIIAFVFLGYLVVSGAQSDLQYYQSKGPENIRPILSQFKSLYQPGDQVYVYYGAEWQFRYYLRDQQLDWIAGKWHRNNPELYITDVAPVILKNEKIWLIFSHCYQEECDQIRDFVATARPLELVTQDNDVWLYLAP